VMQPPAPPPTPTRQATGRLLAVLGLFFLLTGVALLLVPHRFTAGIVEKWASDAAMAGTAMLLAGGLLLWIRALPVHRLSVVLAGFGLATALLGMEIAAVAADWDRADAHFGAVFGALLVAVLVAFGLEARWPLHLPTRRFTPTFSAAALAAQLAALATGGLMLALPDAYDGAPFDGLRGGLTAFGAAFVGLGALALVGGFGGGTGGRVLRATNILLAAAFAVSGGAFARERVWIGLAVAAVLALGALDPAAVGFGAAGRSARRGVFALNSARRQVALTTSTVFVVLALALSLVSAERQETQARERVLDGQLALARVTSDQLDGYLQTHVNGLNLLEDYVENVPGLDPGRLYSQMRDLAEEFPGFPNVSLVDRTGRETVRTDDDPRDGSQLHDLSTEPVIAAAPSTRDLRIGEPMLDPRTGEQVIPFTQGIFSEADRPLGGALVGFLSLPRLHAFLGGAMSEEGATAGERGLFVVDADGRPLVVTDDAAAAVYAANPEAFAEENPAVREVLAGRDGTRRVVQNGEPALYGYAPVAGIVDWGVLVEESETTAFAGIRELRDQTFLLLALAGAVAAVIGLLLARIVLKPAAALVAPVAALAQGQYDAPLPAADDSEIGQLTVAFATMRDDLREREDRLVAYTQELEASNRLKGEFLTTMSHELRSPMDGILGYGHLLLDGVDGDLTPEQAADVAQITESADHLLRVIDNLLDLSKIEAGHMELSVEPVDVTPIVNQVRNQLALEAGSKGVDLLIDAPAGLPTVAADPTSVRQILSNLVGNAVKFTDRGRVAVTVREHGDMLRLSVADSGVGIPPEAQEYIFEAFRQADGSATRRFGGTGLGLAISRKLAEMQGGAIAVSSQVGVGSTFTLTLPIHGARPFAPPAETAPAVPATPSPAIAPASPVFRPPVAPPSPATASMATAPRAALATRPAPPVDLEVLAEAERRRADREAALNVLAGREPVGAGPRTATALLRSGRG